MSEILTVFRAEFLRKFRSRVFLVATVAGIVFIALITVAPSMLSHIDRASTNDIVLAGPFPLRAQAATLLQARHDFNVVAAVDELPPRVTVGYLQAHGKAAAAVAVSVARHRLHLDIYPRDLAAFDGVQFRSLIPLSVSIATGIPAARITPATRIERSMHAIDAKFNNTASATFAHGIAFGLVFILYFAIIFASQSVMSSVAEEKTSRIAEILVATISPTNLLAGKTLAAATLSVVQIVAWVASALALAPNSLLTTSGPDSISRLERTAASATFIDPAVIVAFVAFFVLGFLQYATIYAAVASLISRTEDLGSVTTPVILPVVGAFLIAQDALVDPNGGLAVAFSFVPFFSPFVIFTRIAVASVPPWQVALALAINVATVAVAFYVAGKIYRVGMLLYGKLPSPKQIWAALRY